MKIQGINTNSLGKAAAELPSVAGEDKKLKDTCKQFESLFLNQLLTSMRKTIPKSDLMGQENKEMEMYDSMMDQEMSKAWASSDGIGLANMLYQQMKQGKS